MWFLRAPLLSGCAAEEHTRTRRCWRPDEHRSDNKAQQDSLFISLSSKGIAGGLISCKAQTTAARSLAKYSWAFCWKHPMNEVAIYRTSGLQASQPSHWKKLQEWQQGHWEGKLVTVDLQNTQNWAWSMRDSQLPNIGNKKPGRTNPEMVPYPWMMPSKPEW